MTRNRRCVPAHGLTQQLSCVVHQGLDLVRLWRMGGSGVGYVFSSMFHFVYVDSLLAAHAKRWYIDRDSISAFFFFYLFPLSLVCVCVCMGGLHTPRWGRYLLIKSWRRQRCGMSQTRNKTETRNTIYLYFNFLGCLKDVKLENTADFVCFFLRQP